MCVFVCECDVWSRKYKAVEVTVFVKKKKENTYLSNTPTILCVALLSFSLFSLSLRSSVHCYAFLQCTNVKTMQCNAMDKFVAVLDDPQKNRLQNSRFFPQNQ